MRPNLLYLDTARLGRMSPSAQRANHDFTAFAVDEGTSPRLERFLHDDPGDNNGRIACDYPGLVVWKGLGYLKRSLRLLVGSQADLPVLLAHRSAQLMKFAARLLFHPCRNVLATDLDWPGYREILAAEAAKAARRISISHVRDGILRCRLSDVELIDQLCKEFVQNQCDGLFLTAVNNLGVRLPVEHIVRSIEAVAEIRFVVVDGAQDFCHAGTDLQGEFCDLYITGCHKWLQAYYPLGIGFYGRRASRSYIESLLSHLLACGDIDDPLLRVSSQPDAIRAGNATETINLAPLFTCQGAVSDAWENCEKPQQALLGRVSNAAMVAQLAAQAGWTPIIPQEPFRSGILLLQTHQNRLRKAAAEHIRWAFFDHGIALTAYDDGVIRLSLPNASWREHQAETLRTAFSKVT